MSGRKNKRDRIEISFKQILICLAIMMSSMLLTAEGRCHSQTTEKNKRPLATNIPSINQLFVGRQEQLKKLQEKLNMQKMPGIISIVGMAGVGKTQLAKQYAHAYVNDYDVVWWVDANQELLPQIREFGLKLNSLQSCPMPDPQERTPKAWIQAIHSCQEQHSSKILLLIDDIKEKEFITPITQIIRNIHLLLTSRNQSIGENMLSLKCFTPEESLSYLNKLIPGNPQDSINKLRETLSDYPLALIQAAAYMQSLPSLSVEDYIQLYKKKKAMLWKKEENLLSSSEEFNLKDNYHQTISSTFTLLLEEVKRVSPQAYDLLKLSSFLGSQDISKQFLQSWMIEHKHLDEFVFHEALSTLVKYSIFEKNSNDNEKTENYSIHVSLHEFIRNNLKEDERTQYLGEATHLLLSYLPDSSYHLWKVLFDNRFLDFHIESLLNFAAAYNFHSNELLILKIKNLHNLYFSKSEFETSVEKLSSIEKSVTENDKISSLEKARFLVTSGNMAAITKGCDQSIAICEEAENLLMKIPSQEAREELFFLLVNNLMEFYTNKGDLKKAEEAGRKAERLLPYVNYPTHLILYYFMRSLQLLTKGEFEEALRHIDTAIGKFPSTDFPDHFHLFNKLVKSEILAKSGELEKALDLAQKTYDEFKKYYPNDSNFKLFRTEMILAFLHLKQGELEKSRNFVDAAVKGFNNLFKKPDENPVQGFSHIILGEIYEKQNNLLQALSEYKTAEDIYNHIYKTVDVDDMSYLYRNLAVLGEKLKDDFITQTYFQLLLKHFGRDHFRTQEVVDYLETRNRQVPWSKL